MGKFTQIEIKHRTYCFCSDMINLKNFNSNLLRIDKGLTFNIYYIEYITIKRTDDCENIYSVNPLYLLVNHASGFIKEKKWK